MITVVLEIVVGLMLVIGASFAFVASLGILRLKDVYMRMHAGSKAGTLGSGLMLLALAIYAGDAGVVTRAIAGVIFFLLTAPISAHLLAKAAYVVGYRPCGDTKLDALAKVVTPKN
ncbi:multicomponent Na+:H+ antiporter subunit G [Roseibium hamelinense]|uniref:Multicomponent Na+:H+ antiporter subunit G n=1 Tax=Roseibium hamelinense TaxID=150831 RepID=A0A562TI63_9HYPH|nr:monovalent cation/H(+) antiporter subunit G [Roseibium hamelinense]MTI42657.1 monovalent cation/H(+) antiporter subunit G [Roseibium hamelinense]TWI93282.1 multicomponent Na+:H+ antiporter subunit G [Roseibium hamelinense]